MKIGIVGLGNMGAPMAENLAAAGHDVSGFDVSGVVPDGVTSAGSAADAAKGVDAVITMLPDGAIMRAVWVDLLPAMSPGALAIDCSTIDVATARDVAALAERDGIPMIDAPVSGGIGGAKAGTLTFMCGGSDPGFAAAEPLFSIMGQRAVHCGGAGAGQAAKICNNMLLGISMIGACEAFALADGLGLDRAKLFDVVSTSSGSCWSVNTYCPVPGVGPDSPADNDYKPGFAAELMLKDLRLSQEASQESNVATPLGEHAAGLYADMVDAVGNGTDFSAMLNFLKGRAKRE